MKEAKTPPPKRVLEFCAIKRSTARRTELQEKKRKGEKKVGYNVENRRKSIGGPLEVPFPSATTQEKSGEHGVAG